MAEWTNPLLSHNYAVRVANLLNGGGGFIPLNGGAFLNIAPNPVTVFDDLSVDTLIGGAGLDWFFKPFTDLGPLNPALGETVT